jgi:hypothetical protein
MNRRDFITAAGGAALLAAGAAAGQAYAAFAEYDQGCIDDPVARALFVQRRKRPYFGAYRGVAGTGQRTQTLLWKAYEKVVGPFVPGQQELGDCTGMAVGCCADMLTTTQIAMMGHDEAWRGRAATEPLYAGGRVEIGKYPPTPANKLGGGCPLEYVVDFAIKYGILLREQYGDIDLTTYRPDLAKAWGTPGVGVPDALEPIAKQHPIKTGTLIRNVSEAADAIANGYPIALGFHCVGFKFKTDRDGFAVPTWRLLKQWHHAQAIVGADTLSGRPGFCLAQQWGPNWLEGPVHKLGVIPGGMWVDAHVLDRMIQWGGAAVALSNYVGYPRRKLEYRLW